MIMSCFTKIEMSSFRGAIMPRFNGRYYGQGGDFNDETERFKEAGSDQEGDRKGDEAGQGSGDIRAKCKANPEDGKEDKRGRGWRDHTSIER